MQYHALFSWVGASCFVYGCIMRSGGLWLCGVMPRLSWVCLVWWVFIGESTDRPLSRANYSEGGCDNNEKDLVYF